MGLSESLLLEKYLRPLCDEVVGRNLQDDSASLPMGNYIVSTDNLVEGVHFLPDTEPEYIASRLLARNLSDMAGSGARPLYYLLNWVATDSQNEAWIKRFCDTLAEWQAKHNIKLIGGDGSKGSHLTLSMTIFGEPLRTPAPTRLDAKAEDAIFISGELGGAYLGLQSLRGMEKNSQHESRYLQPPVRCELMQKIIAFLGDDLHACMDISDGLPLDCMRICEASKVSAVIDMEKVPLVEGGNISGGDDYELLFTVAKSREDEFLQFINEKKLPLTKIGKIMIEKDSYLVHWKSNGEIIHIDDKGWEIDYAN